MIRWKIVDLKKQETVAFHTGTWDETWKWVNDNYNKPYDCKLIFYRFAN